MDKVIFDEFSKIRILEPQSYDESEKLKEQCQDFITKINDFSSIVSFFLDMINEKSHQVEKEKLLTIGLRIKVENQQEQRKVKLNRLLFHIGQRQAELDRLIAYTESLEKVKREQLLFIDSFGSK
ncbi:Intraflagellar transport protein 20 [Boothiomyces sp. JEL0838]|nr:Intraflagellar transport protein 20 [Boothiomyces sp. JEL0838]